MVNRLAAAADLPPECVQALDLMRQALIESGVTPEGTDQLLSRATQGIISVEAPDPREAVRRIKRSRIRTVLLELAEDHSIPPSVVIEVMTAAAMCFAPSEVPPVELDVAVEDGSGRSFRFDPQKESFQVDEQGEDLIFRIRVENQGATRLHRLNIVTLMTPSIVAYQAIDQISLDLNPTSTVLGRPGAVFSETDGGFVFSLGALTLDPGESLTITFSGVALAPGIASNRIFVSAEEMTSLANAEELTHVLFGTCGEVSVSALAGGTILMSGDGLAPVSSGVIINPGDEVLITATGRITIFGSEPHITNDPSGLDFDQASAFTFLLPDDRAPDGESAHVAGALLRRTGTGDFSYVGDASRFVAQSAGEIQLAVNDIQGFFSDNLGAFTATVCVRN
jgi:hypothetical protein